MVRVQSDCLLAWRNAIESAFANMNAFIKCALRPRCSGRSTAYSDPVSGLQTDPIASEDLEKGKDVNFSLSIDSTASSESDGTRPPRVPVLLINQPPIDSSGSERSGMVVDRNGSDDLDFLTALRTS